MRLTSLVYKAQDSQQRSGFMSCVPLVMFRLLKHFGPGSGQIVVFVKSKKVVLFFVFLFFLFLLFLKPLLYLPVPHVIYLL